MDRFAHVYDLGSHNRQMWSTMALFGLNMKKGLIENIFKYRYALDHYICRKCVTRYYGNNPLRRKPIRVLDSYEKAKNRPIESVSNRMCMPDGSERSEEISEKAKNRIDIPLYVKLKENDGRFSRVLTLLKSRRKREKSDKILLEGVRLINDAIEAGVTLNTIYFSREETLENIRSKDLKDVEIFKVLYKQLEIWSDLTKCPGIMGVFKRPPTNDMNILNEGALPVIVVCDNVRDPGNMGSILRCSAAAGCSRVLLTKGCVDIWDQKVLRAGCGAHFRVPIINNIKWEYLVSYIPKDADLYLAETTSDLDYTVSEIAEEEFEEDDDDSEQRYVHVTKDGKNILTDKAYIKKGELEKYVNVSLPCYPYSSIKYSGSPCVVFIGGETHGLSPQANKLACEFGGHRITIPMENKVESLNSAFAMAIIVYEIKRQFDVHGAQMLNCVNK